MCGKRQYKILQAVHMKLIPGLPRKERLLTKTLFQ
jgi:hypothetical protein